MNQPVPAKQLCARDIMATRLVTLTPELDVFRGVAVLIKNKISGAPVVDQEQRLLGIFSEKSVMKVLIDAAYDQLPTSRLDAFMDRTPLTIEEDTQLLSIAQIFLNTPRRRLPVLDGERLVGQVSRRDVLRSVYKFMQVQQTPEKVLLYLSALHPMDKAPVG